MSLTFRHARREDVARIVEMLSDDVLGQGREAADLTPYLAAFDRMGAETHNQIFVGEQDGRIVATYQLFLISSLSHTATRRAEIEAVRVDASLRGQGLGEQLMRDAEKRARAEGCGLLQFTSNKSRDRAHAFYKRMGYVASHEGFKRKLD